MQTILHDININSTLWTSTTNSRLLRLKHHASQSVPVNVCEFSLSHPGDVQVQTGDSVEVKLGVDNSKELVFTGTVAEVFWQLESVQIHAASETRRLTSAHFNMYFERPFAGDIVKAICDEASVPTGRVDPGLPLDFYAVGAQINAFDHILKLAARNGFDLYADTKDQLQFGFPIPGNVHMFNYGVNVLSLNVTATKEGVSGIEIHGESPASLGQGPLAAHWLTKKEVRGAAGDDSGRMKRIVDPSVRNIQTANLMAQAQLLKEKAKHRADLLTMGRPDINIGDLALITQMPVSDQNGTYKVNGIHHSVHPKKGFTTLLNLEEIL